jgi:hypothetical protein
MNHLLDTAGLLGGVQKFSPSEIRQRASSPKFQVHNTALMSAGSVYTRDELRANPAMWGRWVESAVGAHLLNHLFHRHLPENQPTRLFLNVAIFVGVVQPITIMVKLFQNQNGLGKWDHTLGSVEDTGLITIPAVRSFVVVFDIV